MSIKTFNQNQPVVVAHIVLWVLTNVSALIAEHSSLLSASDLSSLVQALVPIVTGLVLSAFAWYQHRRVTPVAKSKV